MGECPVDPMRMRVGSIVKLDQKSKVKKVLYINILYLKFMKIDARCGGFAIPFLFEAI